MSVTVSNCYEIARSCINNSKAKQLYSIPKEERFPARKDLGPTPIHYYNKNLDSFVPNGANFGTSIKDNIFLKRDQTPSPTSYNVAMSDNYEG